MRISYLLIVNAAAILLMLTDTIKTKKQVAHSGSDFDGLCCYSFVT